MRFHGTQKKKTWALGNFDIVITTFETLVRQQKRHENPECRDETLYSFFWHRIVLDEGMLHFSVISHLSSLTI
jgi:SWI/SNF-related matrix-associated actin-dependent regulator of chromatin subfamily A3